MPSRAEWRYRLVSTRDERRSSPNKSGLRAAVVTSSSGITAFLAVVLVVLAMTSPAAGQEQPATRRIMGLPMEAVEHIPGVRRLFEVRNASATPTILRDEKFRLGEVVARFDLEQSDDDVLWLARRAGADRVVRKSPLGLFLIIGPPSQVATERVMVSLWETGRVVMISPNYVGGGLTFVPNDPHHVNGDQWYQDAPSDIDLDLREAWDITRGSSNVVVAVMDTGILVNHPEFSGRLWVNPGEIPGNGFDDDGNGYVDDIHGWDTVQNDADFEDPIVGHGTYVSSVLIANAGNSRQIAGFDHSAKLLTVRAIDQLNNLQEDFIRAAFDYLVLMSPHYDILNMSWEWGKLLWLGDRLDSLAQAGVLMFAGAGNSGKIGWADMIYPASHPEVISVQGLDDVDALAYFSNTGNSIDFSAPGVGIFTASWDEPFAPSASHVSDGTSLACPMVAGTASLGLAIRPAMTKRELIFALKKSAVDLGATGCDAAFGCGSINTKEALLVLESLIFFDDLETGDLTQWSSSSP